MSVRRGRVVAALTAITAATLGAQQPNTRPSATVEHDQPPPVFADSGPSLVLTRQQAIDSALAHNPTLVTAREQVAQARARATQAVAIPDPSLTASIIGQTGALSPGTAGEHDYSLGLTVPFPDRIRLRGKVATADVRSSQLSYQQLRQQIASRTSQTYDSLLVSLRHLDDVQQAKQLAQDFLVRSHARFQAGTSPRLDVIKAKVDVAQAQNAIISGQRQVVNARASLNRLIGRMLGAAIAPADSLDVPAPLPDLAALERRAAALRPELKSLDAQRAGASAATTLAKEFWLPDISVGLTRLNVIGAPATYETDIGIGFPIFFWQHTGGEVAESQHHERALAASRRDLAAQVDQDVRLAYSGAATAMRQVQYLRDELLPEAQRAYHIADTSYVLGGSSALEVLDARRTLLDAQTQFTDALGAVNDAIAQLELAVGAPITTDSPGAKHD